MLISELGEKELIRKIVKPITNPNNIPELAGDDCAQIKVNNDFSVCLSTDRVPSDLIALKLGLIDYYQLGYYLAVLNISDVVASGSKPAGLLLNLAFDNNFEVADFESIMLGAKKACNDYGCEIVGGDLSHSTDMSLSATSIGFCDGVPLYRRGSINNDYIYCSDYIGITSTAFKYFLEAKDKGLKLLEDEEEFLCKNFRTPEAKIELSRLMKESDLNFTSMDNTDGLGQTLLELSEINNIGFIIDKDALPIHDISRKVADYLCIDVVELVLGTGADFQLIGTFSYQNQESCVDLLNNSGLKIIGVCREEYTGVYLRDGSGNLENYQSKGWDYFKENGD